MNNIIERDDNPNSSKNLSKTGVSAVFQLAGGIALSILGVLPIVLSTVAGGALTILGLAAVSSRDKEDKKIGMVLTVAGAAAILSRHGVIPFLKAGGAMVLHAGAFVLIGLGLFNIIKFVIGLKKRS
ncbi:MAG: hypothetical protein LBK66_10680 [Spirochaetaceae bacterium]|jgi:hypothetical protein|nr:hypothetical protein [Spirochaetaceae bacterium]